MKKFCFIFALIFGVGNFLLAQTWDILDKSMTAYNQNNGTPTGQAWAVYQGGSAGSVATQQSGYVNFTKTNTGSSQRWAWIRPAIAIDNLTPGMAYSIEIKARVQAINVADDATYFEANQICLRLGSKGIAAPIYLRYGNGTTGGSVNVVSGVTNAYGLNTSVWQIYRLVFHTNHSSYDVYVAGVEEPIFENVGLAETSDQNGVYVGAESYQRCNMDIEYVKMGTGDFFSKSKIASVVLSSDSHIENSAGILTVTANTVLINDDEKLLVSLVDGEGNIVVKAVEAVVSQNKAELNFSIPATVPKGNYFIKVSVPNGKIGDVDVNPKKAEYLIATSLFAGKHLITFGNSITSADNSWAYQTYSKLGFGTLYNGAFAGACWYKRARLAQDGDSIWTQDYSDLNFAGMSNGANTDREQFQKIINNCAVVHIQKYLIENPDASPDYAILSYGTNDVASATMGSVEETMSKALSEVNLFTMAGALRWCIETLQTKFPGLVIYVALPLQARDAGKNSDNIKKIRVITGICDALSVSYFDCFNESGITVENQAKYLRDGLHPNEDGQKVHAKYIMMKLEEAESGQSSIVPNEAFDEFISISGNLLQAGQPLLVKSLKDDAPLTETALYGMAGNRIFRNSVSGNEVTLNVPAVAGMYVLTVRLADNTSKEFKVLVK